METLNDYGLASGRILEELRLISQVSRDLGLIGSIADEIVEQYAIDDPRRREGERIRNEVATLCEFIAEVMI